MEWPTEPAANSVGMCSRWPPRHRGGSGSASFQCRRLCSGSVREPHPALAVSSPGCSAWQLCLRSRFPGAGCQVQWILQRRCAAGLSRPLGDWQKSTHNGIGTMPGAKDAAVRALHTAGNVVPLGLRQLGSTVGAFADSGPCPRLCGAASPAVKEGETVSAGQTLGKRQSAVNAPRKAIHLEVK